MEITGKYNGEGMETEEGKVYPVPGNYASKSRLIEGDKLSLKNEYDGISFKQIDRAPRKTVLGSIVYSTQEDALMFLYNSRKYKLLYQAVTFFKAEESSEFMAIIREDEKCDYVALDNKII